jgi:MscS family membrane protein
MDRMRVAVSTPLWLLAFAILLLLLIAPQRPSGAQGLLPELDTSSPAATLGSFITETRRLERLYVSYRAAPSTVLQRQMANTVNRAADQLFDLREVSPAIRARTGAAMVGYLSDILDRLPEIPLDTVPGGQGQPRSELPIRWTIPGTEIRIVRLTDGPRTGDYVFSADTVALLPAFHAQAVDIPLRRRAELGDWGSAQRRLVGPWLARLSFESLPTPLTTLVLGNPLWKLLATAAVALVVLGLLTTWIGLARRWSADAPPWRRQAVLLTVPALLAVLTVVGHDFVTRQVILNYETASVETVIAIAVLYATAAWAVVRGAWLIAEVIIASPAFPDGTYDAHLVRIVARVVSLLAAAATLIYGANSIGLPALGLLAGVSVGGIALALAAQSTVENLLGGIVIFADRPFRVGDEIRFGGLVGKVEDIGPRSTRIRAADGTVTTVPNSNISRAQLTNVSARPSSVFQQRLSLPGSLSADKLEKLVVELRRRIAAHPLVENGLGQPMVYAAGFGTGGELIEVEVFARVLTTSGPAFKAVQQALVLEILRALEAAGVSLASEPVPAKSEA